MKLMRIGESGHERAVVRVDSDTYVEATDIVGDFDSTFFSRRHLGRLASAVDARVAAGRIERFAGERIASPIVRPSQIVCVDGNYSADFDAGSAGAPRFFMKPPNTMTGPHDDVRIPGRCTDAGGAVELGIVMAGRVHDGSSDDELNSAIAGFVLVNQIREESDGIGGFMAETFTPTGPWLVTLDEVSTVGDLEMWCVVDGVAQRTGSTSHLSYGPRDLIRHLAQFMTLEPGDLVCAGGPPLGRGAPDGPLRDGDFLTLGIEELGEQAHAVVSPRVNEFANA